MTPFRHPFCLIADYAPFLLLASALLAVPRRFDLAAPSLWIEVPLWVTSTAAIVVYVVHLRIGTTCFDAHPAEGPTEHSRTIGRRMHTWMPYVLVIAAAALIGGLVLDTFGNGEFLSDVLFTIGDVLTPVFLWLLVAHRRSWCPICRPDKDDATEWSVPPLGKPTSKTR